MPPKRKAASGKAKAKAAEDLSALTVAQLKKRCKAEGLEENGKKQELVDRLSGESGPPAKLKKESTIQKALKAMSKDLKDEKKALKKMVYKIDEHFGGGGKGVHKDYSAMLNQTNIGHNNNKFYVVQVVEENNGHFTAFNRWGRVGEPGQQSKRTYTSVADAIADFEKKFTDKTKNAWKDRAKFVPKAGKYTLIEMGQQDDDPAEKALAAVSPAGALGKKTYLPSKLDAATRRFVDLIFNHDMFQSAMAAMEIDVAKLPLGKLSKAQIAKGFSTLDAISGVLRKKAKGNLTELSSQFYTVIPHSFPRSKVPPVINSEDALRAKLDMLLTLGDIEIAAELMKQGRAIEEKAASGKVQDPLDVNYKLLNCELSLVTKGDKEFQVLEQYLDATNSSNYRKLKIVNVWRMDRGEAEAKRFKAHDGLGNRKLLWHGTNVAVVAAILKSGLRIMPHAGGRVGRGLYFASENSKSAAYVGTAGKTGIMFLNEVALGKEKEIKVGDGSLTAAPPGFDSVVARGTQEPDPKQDTTLTLEGKKVVVPKGKPVNQPKWQGSHFNQSEYLVYKESQVRMRYVLQLQFGN